MPEFSLGEHKTAVAPMTNPTAKAFDYVAELYMGTNLALMAQTPFHLEAEESKDISLPVTMPSDAGTYPVHIGVFSAGENIALYKAVEDVVIKVVPAVGDFVYSNQVCGMATYAPAPSWIQATYSCKITNRGSRGTRIITFHYTYYHTYAHEMFRTYSKSFELALEPGQSYTFTWWSGIDFNSVFGSCARITMWLEDNAGGGTTPCVQETPYA